MMRDADTLGPPVSETRDGAGSSVSSREERVKVPSLVLAN
jgi:hypothetical protein